jgi:hypothetical protein
MDTKQLIDALKDLEPHVDSAVYEQQKFLEVRFTEAGPAMSLPITNATLSFVTEGDVKRAVILLS